MYNRLFQRILYSSVWNEDVWTRVVWLTLIAAMDQDGFVVSATEENLARLANIPIDQTRVAVEKLTSPDPLSTNPDNDGRRIEKVPGGYVVLNAAYYRTVKNMEHAREMNRIRNCKYRERKRDKKNDAKSSQVQSCVVTPVSVYASVLDKGGVGGKENGKARGTMEEIKKFCSTSNMTDQDAIWFFNKCEGCGWTNGGRPIKDWQATIRSWSAAGYLPSQKNGSNHQVETKPPPKPEVDVHSLLFKIKENHEKASSGNKPQGLIGHDRGPQGKSP